METTSSNRMDTSSMPPTPLGIAPVTAPSLMDTSAEKSNRPATRPMTTAITMPTPRQAKMFLPRTASRMTTAVGMSSRSPAGI